MKEEHVQRRISLRKGKKKAYINKKRREGRMYDTITKEGNMEGH